MAALIGLIAGALRALWPYTAADGTLHGPAPSDPVGSVVALGVLGFSAVPSSCGGAPGGAPSLPPSHDSPCPLPLPSDASHGLLAPAC